jgi:hyperosmotically inducible periplasmic protein
MLLVVVAAMACNRNTGDANAERRSEQVKAVAVKAGHQLADSWLTTKIQAQYFADDDIKARHINVSTRDGVVTLTGFVEGEPQRELALQIARTTDGVRQVKDGLTLAAQPADRQAVATTGTGASATSGASQAPAAPETPAPPSASNPRVVANDALITARVQSKFYVDDRVKGRRIDVDTRDGVVTLSGQVADENERAQTLLLARTTEGVARVEDHLTIAPYTAPTTGAPAAPIDDATVTTTIQAKYFVDPTVKASAVDVSARDGVVTLQGTVADDAARKQAIAIAQNTGGVAQVIDRLTVAPTKR